MAGCADDRRPVALDHTVNDSDAGTGNKQEPSPGKAHRLAKAKCLVAAGRYLQSAD